MAEDETPTCGAINLTKGQPCTLPAKVRSIGNMPLCGIHGSSAERRGSEIRPL